MKSAPVYFGIVVAIICMATSSILIRESSAPSLVIAFYRLLFTTGLALLFGGLKPWKRARRLPARDKRLLVVAGIALSFHFALWITSLSHTSVASSVLFTNLQVIFVLVLSWVVLHEKTRACSLLGILIALAGSALVVQGDLGQGKLGGDLMSLASGFFIAISLIVARGVRPRVDLWTYTFVVSAACTVSLWFMCQASGQKMTGYQGQEFALFLVMALLPGIGGHGLINWALKYIKAPIVAVTILGEAVGASILAWIIFGENLALYQVAGGLLILSGIYLTARHSPGTQV